MAKTEKRTDTVRTGVFSKEIRVPIDPDDVEKKELQATRIQLKIRKIQKDIQPETVKITQLRTEHRKLLEDIEAGTELTKAKVYEVKDFKRMKADIFLAETDEKVDTRPLEKADLQADMEESAAEA